MNKLVIDTTDTKKTKVTLIAGLSQTSLERENLKRSQATLVLARELLEKEKISLNELDEIEVNPGPGSFTGIRVGMAIANAIAYAFKIKVNGNDSGEVKAIYK